MTSEPFEQASEGDALEQQASITEGGSTIDPVSVTSSDANEADALEQGADVDEADDLYPHAQEASEDD